MVSGAKSRKVIKRRSRGKGRIIKKGISSSINSNRDTQLKTQIETKLAGTLLKRKQYGTSKSTALRTPKKTERKEAFRKKRKSGTSVHGHAENKISLFEFDKSQPDPEKILEALDILKSQLVQQRNHLFRDEPLVVYLNITGMKICKGSKIVRIALPHSLLDENAEVCLFTVDLEKGRRCDPTPAIEECKELLKSNGVTKISEVITLGQVRTEYGEFETKRALCSRFDFFLSDSKINGHLIHHLGKTFYSRKKIPVPVDLKHRTLKNHIDIALSKSYFLVNSTGNLFTMKVGHTNLTNDQICENIMAVVHKLPEVFPGGWNNVLRLDLRGQNTVTLPLYVSTRADHSVGIPKAYKSPKAAVSYTDDLDWLGQVQVRPFGTVVIKKRDRVEQWQRVKLNDGVKPPKRRREKRGSDLEHDAARLGNMNSIDEGMSAFAYENLQNTMSLKERKATMTLKGNGRNQEKKSKRKMEDDEKGDNSLSDDDDDDDEDEDDDGDNDNDHRKVQFYEQAYLQDLAKSRDEEEHERKSIAGKQRERQLNTNLEKTQQKERIRSINSIEETRKGKQKKKNVGCNDVISKKHKVNKKWK